ncbi:alpha/beta hydrolase family protein [Leptospira fainei serovar Hurstbridge str. BUT 6]|uniref:Alpha/beta hydrolase family protein n=1 Tax=Leptospira fainei serovar Hurstbridge str. BUT 6 TaxID=1193011 RepID=S3W4V8_9LEPT|nr:prolyl oligopeptidase family serine peptidase [Leptospira fainei]EPG75302.1 alpha/beta hydrolase family protein [Leptospira fainei serovar Hurstbridge str. BUT 6]
MVCILRKISNLKHQADSGTRVHPKKKIVAMTAILFFLSISNCVRKQNGIHSRDIVTSHSIRIQERERSFLIFNPFTLNDGAPKKPLVIALHGRLGSGKQIMSESKLNSIAVRETFIAVYPDGYKRSWADGRGRTPADKEQIDDVLFIESLLSYMIQNYNIDPTKVFIFGHSNGGFMTQRLLSEKGSLFKAGVSVSSQLSISVLKKHHPSLPISVAIMTGTDDPIVPFFGGFVLDGGEIIGAEESITRWADWNRCSPAPLITNLDNKDDETSLEIRSYENCAGKTKARLYKIIGAGHQWPGNERRSLFGINLGKPTQEVNASEEIWKFFRETYQ